MACISKHIGIRSGALVQQSSVDNDGHCTSTGIVARLEGSAPVYSEAATLVILQDANQAAAATASEAQTQPPSAPQTSGNKADGVPEATRLSSPDSPRDADQPEVQAESGVAERLPSTSAVSAEAAAEQVLH